MMSTLREYDDSQRRIYVGFIAERYFEHVADSHLLVGSMLPWVGLSGLLLPNLLVKIATGGAAGTPVNIYCEWSVVN